MELLVEWHRPNLNSSRAETARVNSQHGHLVASKPSCEEELDQREACGLDCQIFGEVDAVEQVVVSQGSEVSL